MWSGSESVRSCEKFRAVEQKREKTNDAVGSEGPDSPGVAALGLEEETTKEWNRRHAELEGITSPPWEPRHRGKGIGGYCGEASPIKTVGQSTTSRQGGERQGD